MSFQGPKPINSMAMFPLWLTKVQYAMSYIIFIRDILSSGSSNSLHFSDEKVQYSFITEFHDFAMTCDVKKNPFQAWKLVSTSTTISVFHNQSDCCYDNRSCLEFVFMCSSHLGQLEECLGQLEEGLAPGKKGGRKGR